MWADLKGILAVIWPVAAALGILAAAQRRREGPQPLPAGLAVLGLSLSLLTVWLQWPGDEADLFDGAIRRDAFGLFLTTLASLCGLATVLLSGDYLKRRKQNHPEFYVLVLFAVTGMALMGMSRNMLTILFGLETMSISLYVLSGFFRDSRRSVESSIKYYLTGSFATGLLLFGMGLIYGGAGSLDLTQVVPAMTDVHASRLILLGTGFVVAGFAFKVAAVPFHMWLPDVYEGAPTTVTGFMATGVKVAAFGALVRVFCVVYQSDSAALRDTLWWIALMTMTVGNVAALAQSSVKRMLAYSSIAHAGYLLVAIVVMTGVRDPGQGAVVFTASESVRGILFYLLAYAVTNLGAFGVLAHLERNDGSGLQFDDLAGLRARQPLLALALTVFMFSLAGIPGTAGFFGKFMVFGAAIEAGIATSDESFVLLAILGIVNSLVGLYYYLRVPVQAYIKPEPEDAAGRRLPPRGLAFTGVIVLAMISTLWLGFGPDILGLGFGVEPAVEMVKSALESLR